MKYAKIEIDKTGRTEAQTKMVYPTGYDPQTTSPIMYQNEGLDIEFCLALVPDDFTFTDKMVEQSTAEAKALIDSWVDSDKDFNPEGEITKAEIKTRKKAHL